ncbi:MAG: pitrilysin family protein [Cyclobacteriaceae bacterium]
MLDRTLPPPFVKSSSFNLITPEEKKLHNGVHLFFVPGGSQDVLKIELIFEAGRWFENKLGAANFTTHLLSKGTKAKSSFEIAQLFDQYGAHLEVSPGLDFVSIALYTLNKNLAPVLKLLMEILSSPSFPEKELRQTQSVYIQNLKVNNEKTSFVASHLFRKNLFGDTHPYGMETGEKDVNVVQTSDLQKHFTEFIHSAKVFVSGKIEPVSKDLILEEFQQIAPGNHAHNIKPVIKAHPGRQYVEKKDSVQSSLRIGRRSVVRAHPDYVSNLFVSHILGGYFGSRLMKNIREERGLTYGISASVHGLKHDSYLVIGADVNKENVDLTFDEIRKELKNLRATKIAAGELETTRNHFIGSLQSEITTPFAHAEKIKTIALFNLPRDHYQNMISKIERITAVEIADISEQYFHEDAFCEVAVG